MISDEESVESLFHLACAQPPGTRESWVCAQDHWPEPIRHAVIELLRAESSLGHLGSRLAGDVPRGARVGPYELIAPLGRGACGEVHLARRVAPPSWMAAVKVARSVAPEVLLRIASERTALSRVDHPGIARLLDFGELPDGRPWLATEYVPGAPITEHVDATGASTHERIRLLAEACDALMHAHGRALVHRDLKPRNLLVDARGESPRPVLIDLGLAKSLTEPLLDGEAITEVGVLLGTPEFMSPEQASGAQASVRMDIFSMGCLMGSVLTGRPPRRLEELRATGLPLHVAIATVPIDLPSRSQRAHADQLTPRTRWRMLDDIVSRAAAADPSSRHASARELRDDLLDWLRSASHVTGRSTDAGLCGDRRRRMIAAVALVGAIGAAAGVALTLVRSDDALEIAAGVPATPNGPSARTNPPLALDDSQSVPQSVGEGLRTSRVSSRLHSLVLSRLNRQSPRRESEAEFADRVEGLMKEAIAQGERPDATAYLTLAGVFYAASRFREAAEAASTAASLDSPPERVVEAQAALMRANALSMLREDKAAIALAERALTLVRAAFPAGSRERVESETSCWRVLRRASPDGAVKALDALLAVAATSFGKDDRLTVEVEQVRAYALAMMGREDVGLEPNREVFARAKRLLGERDPVTQSAAASLILILGYSDRPQEAIAVSEEMLPHVIQSQGEDSAVALNISLNTGVQLGRVGRREEAVAVLRETYARYCRLFDRGHRLAVHVEELLIDELLALSKQEECIERLRYHLDAPDDPRDVDRKKRLRSRYAEVISRAHLDPQQ
jgi:serine/threonine protein kinase